MQLIINTDERLEDVIRVVGAAYGVTLGVQKADEATTRPSSNRRGSSGRGRRTANRSEPRHRRTPASAEIREWARAQGIDISDRGRISGEVIQAYRAAHR